MRNVNKWRPVHDSSRGYSNILRNPGIYAFKEFDISTRKFKVVYIGKSQDLFTRLGTRHRIEDVWSKDNDTDRTVIQFKYLYCFMLITQDYHDKERQYIKRLAPRYNKQLNPKVKRIIIHTTIDQ